MQPTIGTIDRTPNPACPACRARRLHLRDEYTAYHALGGHGHNGTRWTHPALRPDPPASHDVDELGDSKRNGVNPWFK